MKKIPSIFMRDWNGDRSRVTPEPNPECADFFLHPTEWIPTPKFDGTCCLVRDGKLYRRYTLRAGRNAPEHFEPATEIDTETGKQEGWVPVGDGPNDAVHREVFSAGVFEDGTYELVGPKMQGNPHGMSTHSLWRHGSTRLDISFCIPPRVSFDAVKGVLESLCYEGIVFHHHDGRMAKIKRRDFGFAWPIKEEDRK